MLSSMGVFLFLLPLQALGTLVRNANFDPMFHFVPNVGKDSLFTRIKAFTVRNHTRFIYASEPHRHNYAQYIYKYMHSEDNYNFNDSGVFRIHSGKHIVCFIVADDRNRSGLFHGSPGEGLVSGHKYARDPGMLSYSTDEGQTWKVANHSLDINVNLDEDISVQYDCQFQRWVGIGKWNYFMISPDMLNWTKLNSMCPYRTNTMSHYEPDDFFSLAIDGNETQVKWIVLYKMFRPYVGVEYYLGHFTDYAFVPDAGPHFLEYGPDTYELAIVNQGICPSQKQKILMGSIYNVYFEPKLSFFEWKYILTIPRILELRTIQDQVLITQNPIPQFDDTPSRKFLTSMWVLDPKSNPLSCIASRTFRILATFHVGLATNFGFTIRKGYKEKTIIGYSVRHGQFYVDRSKSGFPYFVKGAKYAEYAEVYRKNFTPTDGRVRFHIVSDASTVEVFCDQGQIVFSLILFASHRSDKMEMFTDQAVVVRDMQLDLYNNDLIQSASDSVVFPCNCAALSVSTLHLTFATILITFHLL